jgi:hypothetical protein
MKQFGWSRFALRTLPRPEAEGETMDLGDWFSYLDSALGILPTLTSLMSKKTLPRGSP